MASGFSDVKLPAPFPCNVRKNDGRRNVVCLPLCYSPHLLKSIHSVEVQIVVWIIQFTHLLHLLMKIGFNCAADLL